MTSSSRVLLAVCLLIPVPAFGAGPLSLKHEGPVRGVAFSSDGRWLYTSGDDGMIRVWDVASGREKRNWQGLHGGTLVLALSADGHTLATAGRDASVRLWDTATGKESARLTGHKGDVEGLVLSGDGRFLAASSSGRSGQFRSPMDGCVLT